MTSEDSTFSREYHAGEQATDGLPRSGRQGSSVLEDIDQEYQTGTQTTAYLEKPIPELDVAVLEASIDTENYISGKPRRIIIRGRISHATDD